MNDMLHKRSGKLRQKMNSEVVKSDLEQRMTRLETVNRRLKWGFMAMIGFIALGAMVGLDEQAPAPPQVIRASRFEVVGHDGRTAAMVTTDSFGGVVALYAPNGKLACRLATNGQGQGTIATFSSDTQRGLAVISGDENGGYISTLGAKGHLAAGLSVTPSGGGVVTMVDATGTGRRFMHQIDLAIPMMQLK